MTDLNIAEIPFEDGSVRYRYARKLSGDGTRWIREGLFVAYHANGALASEGTYENGVAEGPWKDYHDNGQIAAEGSYRAGEKGKAWRYWDRNGKQEAE